MVGDVTERSVMVVGLLPPPLLGVSSLDLAPLAFSQRGLFPCARGSNRAADLCQKEARRPQPARDVASGEPAPQSRRPQRGASGERLSKLQPVLSLKIAQDSFNAFCP